MNRVETTDTKIEVLAELWLNQSDPKYDEFRSKHGISLPLAFLLQYGIIKEETSIVMGYINQAYESLCDLEDGLEWWH